MTQLDSVPEDKDRSQISTSSDSSQGDSLVQSLVHSNKSDKIKEFKSKIPSPLVQQRSIATTLKLHRNGYVEKQSIQIIPFCLDRFKDSWSDFLGEVNRTTSFPRSINSIYTVNGVQINTVSQLDDFGDYICVGVGESFKQLPYVVKKSSSSSSSSNSSKVATTRSEIVSHTNNNNNNNNNTNKNNNHSSLLRPKSGSIKLRQTDRTRRANVTKSVIVENNHHHYHHNHHFSGDDHSRGSSSGPNSLSKTFSEQDVSSIPTILEYTTSLKSVIRSTNSTTTTTNTKTTTTTATSTPKLRSNSPSTSQERRTGGGSCRTSRIPKLIGNLSSNQITASQNFGHGSLSTSVQSVQSVHTPRTVVSTPRLINRRLKTEKAPVSGERRFSRDVTNSRREFVRPRLVTIIRQGMKPRKATRFLLNKKTAHSLDQVLNDIGEIIKPDWGAVRKVYTMNGKEVNALEDFFKNEDIFLACPNDRVATEDFDLDSEECKSIQPYVKVSLVSSQTRRIKGFEGSKSPQRRPKSAHNPVIPSGDFLANYPTHPKYIPLSHFPAPILDKYHVGNVIGDGNFAVVRECTDRISNQKFAMKVIDKSKCQKEASPSDEVKILGSIQHPSIILLYEQYDFSNELYLVMELVSGGDLFDLIAEATKFSEEDTSRMTRDIASALSFLHSHGIVHRDIKPENLLVSVENGGRKRIKLGDFGLAQIVDGPMFTICGTPTYVAPEVLAQSGYGMKVDIWALGVIIYVLICGYPPFVSPTGDQEDLFDLILSGEYEFPIEQWSEVSEDAKDLITRMIESDVDIRLCADEVLDHPFLAVNAEDCEKKRKRFFRRDFLQYSVFEAMGLSNLPSFASS